MKRNVIIFLIIILSIIIPTNISYSNEDITMKEQQDEFKIQDFISNSKKYSGDFFENIDISKILNEAIQGKVDNNTLIKRIFNLFGREVTKNIKTIVVHHFDSHPLIDYYHVFHLRYLILYVILQE